MSLFSKQEKRPVTPSRQPNNPWKAIGVVATENCCEAARRCSGKRFLIPEVPRLPLSDCSAPHCECKYRHFDDRRASARRSIDRVGFSKTVPATDRRATVARRALDS
jgi:hypothetical protein